MVISYWVTRVKVYRNRVFAVSHVKEESYEDLSEM